MPASASATIDTNVKAVYATATALGTYQGQPAISNSISLSSTDITKVYAAARTPSSADALDLTAGLTDAFGAALVFGTVKAAVVKNTHATAVLTVGGGANPLFGPDQYTVKPGQCLVVPNVPAAVTGTAKVLTVTPSAPAAYSVLILGS